MKWAWLLFIVLLICILAIVLWLVYSQQATNDLLSFQSANTVIQDFDKSLEAIRSTTIIPYTLNPLAEDKSAELRNVLTLHAAENCGVRHVSFRKTLLGVLQSKNLRVQLYVYRLLKLNPPSLTPTTLQTVMAMEPKFERPGTLTNIAKLYKDLRNDIWELWSPTAGFQNASQLSILQLNWEAQLVDALHLTSLREWTNAGRLLLKTLHSRKNSLSKSSPTVFLVCALEALAHLDMFGDTEVLTTHLWSLIKPRIKNGYLTFRNGQVRLDMTGHLLNAFRRRFDVLHCDLPRLVQSKLTSCLSIKSHFPFFVRWIKGEETLACYGNYNTEDSYAKRLEQVWRLAKPKIEAKSYDCVLFEVLWPRSQWKAIKTLDESLRGPWGISLKHTNGSAIYLPYVWASRPNWKSSDLIKNLYKKAGGTGKPHSHNVLIFQTWVYTSNP